RRGFVHRGRDLPQAVAADLVPGSGGAAARADVAGRSPRRDRGSVRPLLLLVSALALSLAPGRPHTPGSQSGAEIHIDAVAVDRTGKPVMDLRPQEFEVWIGNFRIPIDTVTVVTPESAANERTIVLLLDDVTLEPARAARVKDAAARF